jgi:hypothetical protein
LSAGARTGPAQRSDRVDAPDAVAIAPIPVSSARAERDAIAQASIADAARRKGGGADPLLVARRIAAALNAPGSGGEGDLGFFWVTALTTDGAIVVANSYGLAYIPDGVQLPEPVHMASADETIPAAERARWATYPVLAVQSWAASRNAELRAIIATEEQLANSDPGAAKVVLQPDDIPASGDMVGRSRLEVVAAQAAARLAATSDLHLVGLLPPAPADPDPAAGTRPPPEVMHPESGAGTARPEDHFATLPAAPAGPDPMLWFGVMKPMASNATGRQAAHLRAFQIFAAHAQDAVLRQAHSAADPADRRSAVADWLYWKHLAGLLAAALADAS